MQQKRWGKRVIRRQQELIEKCCENFLGAYQAYALRVGGWSER